MIYSSLQEKPMTKTTKIVWALTTTVAALVAAAHAQARKPAVITRLYTGADGLTHAEEVEVKFNKGVAEMVKTTGAEIHQSAPGTVNDWHRAPRRQYVITLSGHGEIEVAGGKKIEVGPGNIELAEDLTGKGHITRVIGNEDRVTIQIPLADQTPER